MRMKLLDNHCFCSYTSQLLHGSVLRNEIQKIWDIVCHQCFFSRNEPSSDGFSFLLLPMYERNTHTKTRRYNRNPKRSVTCTLEHGPSPFTLIVIIPILEFEPIFTRSLIGERDKAGPIRVIWSWKKRLHSVWWRPPPSCSPTYGTSIALYFKVLLFTMKEWAPGKSRSMLVLQLWRTVYCTGSVDLTDVINRFQSKTPQSVLAESSPLHFITWSAVWTLPCPHDLSHLHIFEQEGTSKRIQGSISSRQSVPFDRERQY